MIPIFENKYLHFAFQSFCRDLLRLERDSKHVDDDEIQALCTAIVSKLRKILDNFSLRILESR